MPVRDENYRLEILHTVAQFCLKPDTLAIILEAEKEERTVYLQGLTKNA